MNKQALFLENAALLARVFGIEPLLYGSLGLEYRIGTALQADDIDILIPESFLAEGWDVFRKTMEEQGYRLTDLWEHTFVKDGVAFSYAKMEELETFAGISPTQIESVRAEGVSFKLLTLPQYLKVYAASAQDGYRAAVRNKKDTEKIALIREVLKKKGVCYGEDLG